MPDEFLREREDHVGVVHPAPENQQVYTAYVTVPVPPPSVVVTQSLYEVAEDGAVTLVDTRPATLSVTVADDGSVMVQVPE